MIINNNKLPLITIVGSFYNVSQYTERNVNSILKQSYTNIEFIAIDDNSSDKTLSILNRYAKTEERMKVLNLRTNVGLSASRNLGINKSNGEFIMFIDGDDYYKDYFFIEKIIKFVLSKNADWVSFAYEMRYENGKSRVKKVGNQLNNMYSSAWNKIYKAELVKKVRFPVGMHFEDIGVSLELYKLANHRETFNEVGYIYWQREKSIVRMAQETSTHLDSFKIILKELNTIDLTSDDINYFFVQSFNHFLVMMDDINTGFSILSHKDEVLITNILHAFGILKAKLTFVNRLKYGLFKFINRNTNFISINIVIIITKLRKLVR